MQGSVLEKLFFSIGIIDKVTKPSKGMSKALMDIQRQARLGFMDIGKGALTVTGTAAALNAFTTPARGFTKALKEVEALGVDGAELDKLGIYSKKAAADFSMNAAEIVSSGYDIQSSIEGLNNGELAKFTYNSTLLGKAIKSTSAETTAYVSTMSGVFEEQSAKIGKSIWIDQLVGKTAKAVQMFRTTGPEMSAAFAQLGAAGSSQGIGMDEQMTVLGMMQKITGSGAVAATQYKAFLAGVGKAQGQLGLNFTDAQGKMLPMADILDRIRGKFGDTIDVAEGLQLKKAFGSKEAVAAVTAMINKTDGLRGNIDKLSKITGIETALKMAKTQVDPLERFHAITDVLRVTLGQGLLPVLNMLLGVFAEGMLALTWMIDTVPGMKYIIGAVILAVAGLTTALGIMWIVVGASNIVSAFIAKMVLVRKCLIARGILLRHTTVLQRLWNFSMMSSGKVMGGVVNALKFFRLNLLWNKAVMIASAVWAKILGIAQWVMSSGFWASCVAVWGFTAALLACPVTWIVIGIMLLVGAIIALIYYWDEVCDFVMKYGEYLLMLSGPIGLIAGLIIHFWDDIVDAAEWCFNKITGWVSGIWNFGKSVVSGIFKWIIEQVTGFLSWMTKIPIIGGKIQSGLDALKEFAGVEVNQTANVERPVVPTVQRDRNQDVPAGGIMNNNRNKTTNYGGVTINAANPMGPGEIEEMWMLEA